MTFLTPAEPRTDFDLRGKDYLSEREAAHYACVSVSQFRDRREEGAQDQVLARFLVGCASRMRHARGLAYPRGEAPNPRFRSTSSVRVA